MSRQKQAVVHMLETNGYVSRNWALTQYITRLAAIIAVLKKEGWVFQPYKQGGDYRYKVVSSPVKGPSSNLTAEDVTALLEN